MAYTDSKVEAISPGVDSSTKTAIDIAATGTAICRVNHACDLYEVGALIITAPTAESTLTITRNVAPGVTDGASAVAIITIPNGTAIGKIVHKPCHILTVSAPVKLNAGDELKFVMSGTTIVWRPWHEAYPRPEVKANNSDFVLSA
jgi:hypothetical protein